VRLYPLEAKVLDLDDNGMVNQGLPVLTKDIEKIAIIGPPEVKGIHG
jgi:hypothetical protein